MNKIQQNAGILSSTTEPLIEILCWKKHYFVKCKLKHKRGTEPFFHCLLMTFLAVLFTYSSNSLDSHYHACLNGGAHTCINSAHIQSV